MGVLTPLCDMQACPAKIFIFPCSGMLLIAWGWSQLLGYISALLLAVLIKKDCSFLFSHLKFSLQKQLRLVQLWRTLFTANGAERNTYQLGVKQTLCFFFVKWPNVAHNLSVQQILTQSHKYVHIPIIQHCWHTYLLKGIYVYTVAQKI